MSDEQGSGRKRRNPWADNGGNDQNSGRKNPWGGSGNGPGRGSGGGSNEPPDLDELIRKAQDNLKNSMPFNMGSGVVSLLLVAVILIIWLASGFYIINPGEHGVVQRFGAWHYTKADEGLGYHLPFPIEKVTKVNVTELQRTSIGFSNGNSRRDRSNLKIGNLEESLMLTSDRNIVSLHMELQWNIKSAEDYLFNIKKPELTIKKVAESAIREVVGQTDMFTIITTGRAALANKAKEIIQRNLDEYKSGVNIMQVLIQKAEVHPKVQPAFQDVQSARQDAEDTQNQARAYREGILPKARGQAIKLIQEAQAYKQAQIAKAQGDADRFNSVYSAYLSGKDVTKERIYIETMEAVLSNAQKIILDSEGGSQGVVPYLPLKDLGSGKTKLPQPKTEN